MLNQLSLKQKYEICSQRRSLSVGLCADPTVAGPVHGGQGLRLPHPEGLQVSLGLRVSRGEHPPAEHQLLQKVQDAQQLIWRAYSFRLGGKDVLFASLILNKLNSVQFSGYIYY